jgi:phosphoserine phosphatase RsbU/P
MRQHRICVCTSGHPAPSSAAPANSLAVSLTEQVARDWPAAQPPVFEYDPPLIHNTEDPPSPSKLPWSAALVYLQNPGPADREAFETAIERLAQRASDLSLPIVLVVPDREPWLPFQRDGVIFIQASAPTQPPDATLIAGMLFALAERQSAVTSLSRELELAMRCQSGFRVEIDRLHEEMHMAAAVQRQLLPDALPEIPALDFGLIFRPVNYVSGDIYDIQLLTPDHVGFFLADAVGHGVPAALLTMILTYGLTPLDSASSPDTSPTVVQPAEVLRRLNSRLCNSRAGSGRFATAVYGIIELSTRTVTLAGAGHPPPLVLRKGENVAIETAIETNGPLLGVFAEAEYDQATFSLPDDATLVLYTDGLECAFPTDDAPMKRLHCATKRYLEHFRRLAADTDDASPHTIMNRLSTLLDEQAGSLHQSDDVTAIAIAPARRRIHLRQAA